MKPIKVTRPIILLGFALATALLPTGIENRKMRLPKFEAGTSRADVEEAMGRTPDCEVPTAKGIGCFWTREDGANVIVEFDTDSKVFKSMYRKAGETNSAILVNGR